MPLKYRISAKFQQVNAPDSPVRVWRDYVFLLPRKWEELIISQMSVKVKDIWKRKFGDLIMVEDDHKGISQWHVQIS